MGQTATARPTTASPGLFVWLGIVVGIVMPLVSALLYPVYMHQMQPAWAEWTRLMELPFVACELAIIHVAIARGYRDGAIWTTLPRDVKVAVGLLLVGVTVSSIFLSRHPASSFALSVITLIHLRFAAGVFHLVRSEGRATLPLFFPLLSIGLALLTILTAWKFLLPPPEWTVPGGKIEWPSALPGFISVRHLGSWTGAIAAGLMVALLYEEGHRSSTATSLMYLLAAGLTCWSGTRAAVLAMGVVAAIVVISLRRLPRPRALARVAGLSAVSLLTAAFLAPDLPEFVLFARNGMDSANGVSTGRLTLWLNALARWQEAPVFGWGSGSTFWELGWIINQPHNVIVQFLISWGLVGTVGGLWLLGRAIVATHRTGMADPALRPHAAMLYSLLFMSLLEGMLYYPRFIMPIAIGFAVLLAARVGDEHS